MTMKSTIQQLVWLLLITLVLPSVAMTRVATAQDDEDAAAAAQAGDEPEDVPPSAFDVAVQSVIDSNPSEPADLARAIANLIRFERPDLAKPLMGKLIAIPMEAEDQAQLGAAVGSDVLVIIINSSDLGVPAAKFGLEVQQAWRESLRDPVRLHELAEKTVSDNSQQRYLAITELRRGGLAGVQPLVQILANADRSNVHPFAREALVLFGAPAAAPLIAVLETSNVVLKQNVTKVLAQIRKGNTARYLYADALANENESVRRTALTAIRMLEGHIRPADEAHHMLLKMSRDFIDGDRRVEVHVDGFSIAWVWDDAQRLLTETQEHPAVTSARAAARLSRELARLSPQDEEAIRWQFTTHLQLLKLRMGLDKPLGEDGLSMIPPRDAPSHESPSRNKLSTAIQLNDVLAESLRTEAAAAAIASAELLGHLARAGSIAEDLLVQADGHPAPLALALRHADRRVQMAAASAIVAMRRTEGFAGAGALASVLRPVANYSGIRRAVVADPRGNRADELAALLSGQGFEAHGYTTGRGLYQAAIASGENELALIAYTIDKPGVRRLIERLRNDARTAYLPIGLIVDPNKQFEARILAEQYSMVQTFMRPRDADAMQRRVASVLASSGLAYIAPEVRAQQAHSAISMLDELTQRPSPYDLRGMEPALTNAMFNPKMVSIATKVLGQINTHQAQSALIDFASMNALPIESRKAAVAGLTDSLARHGIHLTYQEIQTQAVRYDKSEDLDQETQGVLWSILDALQTIKKKRPQAPAAAPSRS